MEHFRAGAAPDNGGAEPGALGVVFDPFELLAADDPLGDEAAFPSTWQQLAPGTTAFD